mgnify:CR=1 FL=1
MQQFDPLTVQIQPLAQSSLLLDIANAGDHLVAVGQRGNVLLLKNGQWQQVATPVLTQLTKVFFFDDKQGWAVGHDATIIHTNDGGETWTLQMQSTEIEKPFLDVRFYTANDGGMVFYAPIKGPKTSKNTKYTRNELREMLRAGDLNVKTRGITKNNWVFSTAKI